MDLLDYYMNKNYSQLYLLMKQESVYYRTKENNGTVIHKLFRKITKDSPIEIYGRRTDDRVFNNCHAGQRKLLFSEIEFLTKLSKKYDLNNILIVYIGSAAGFHLPLLFALYPELEYVLIDPAKFKFKKYGFTNKYHIINDYYTDETHLQIKKINSNNKLIAVISDFRSEATDEKTYLDMIKQQYWLIQLDAVAYILKTRFPYAGKEFDYKYYQYDIPEDIKHKIEETKTTHSKNSFLYLDGSIYTQIWASPRSSETRIIKIKKSENELFKLKDYDVYAYDGQLNYFNNNVRKQCFKYKKSNTAKYHLFCFDDGYESTVEYYLIYKYLKDYKKVKTPSNEEILQKLFEINNQFQTLIFGNTILCLLKNNITRNIYTEIYDKEYKKIKTSIKQQIKFLKLSMKTPILKKIDYKIQIEDAKETYQELKKLM